MKVREEKLRTIIEWSEKNEDVRVLLLTSSLVNPLALVDEFSDLDIEFVFEDNTNYISDKSWTLKFGNPIAMIEEDESCFNHKHAMKMLLYEDGVKVDFKLYSKSKFIKETQEKELPEDWDIGYKILIDKDGITKQMLKPTYQISIIKKPSEKEFQNLINDFWWDTTYVAKCLVRDEIFYAKFMSETVIRTEYLIPLIEWHIASEHNWNITTNKYGRLFKKYLNQEMWAKTEQTFSGSDIKENWTALFSMTQLPQYFSIVESRMHFPSIAVPVVIRFSYRDFSRSAAAILRSQSLVCVARRASFWYLRIIFLSISFSSSFSCDG